MKRTVIFIVCTVSTLLFNISLGQSEIDSALCDIAASSHINHIGLPPDQWDCLDGVPQSNTCDWAGVTCSGSDIVSLRLTYAELNGYIGGTIPLTIGNLSTLTLLDLSNSNISGAIPESIGELSSLSEFIVSHNNLDSSLPNSLINLTGLNTLDLSYNRLSGSVSHILPHMEFLFTLSLSSNHFIGSLPNSIGKLSNLILLDAFGNSLTGSIPSSVGYMQFLYYLGLSGNDITSTIPSTIGDLTGLGYMYLSSNSITGSIPDTFQYLSSLEILDISDNLLSGSVPDSIVGMQALRVLIAERNMLTGSIPYAFVAMPGLVDIRLTSNAIVGSVIYELSALSNLQYLHLSDNDLTGTLSSELCACPLIEFHVGDNNISCWESCLYDIPNTDFVYVYEECMPPTSQPTDTTLSTPSHSPTLYSTSEPSYHSFTIPSIVPTTVPTVETALKSPSLSPTCTISDQPTVEVTSTASPTWETTPLQDPHALCDIIDSTYISDLDVTGWKCSKGIPESDVCTWSGVGCAGTSVTSLSLSYSDLNGQIGGSLPSSIGSLTSLSVLSMFGAGLDGTIPESLGALTSLEDLSLSNNYLESTLPSSLSRLTGLFYMAVANNFLSGSVSHVVSQMDSLFVLSLSSNMFTGSLPSNLGVMNLLLLFDSYDNFLSGPIPSTMGMMSSLISFDITNNYISGNIPHHTGGLSDLIFLSVGLNFLSGPFPEAFTELSGLEIAHISWNLMTGSLPGEMSGMSALHTLHAENNLFTGAIPSTISKMSRLEDIRLSANYISGSIPSEFGALTKLQYIYVLDNQLTGSIPNDLCACPLKHLYITGNNFDCWASCLYGITASDFLGFVDECTPPTSEPTFTPSHFPTSKPVTSRPTFLGETNMPTVSPTSRPTNHPTRIPTSYPTRTPVSKPTSKPTFAPTLLPTSHPTYRPTCFPMLDPTVPPSVFLSDFPSAAPTVAPTDEPTESPSPGPSWSPTILPSLRPTFHPTTTPTEAPSVPPTVCPSYLPSNSPSGVPTTEPFCMPTYNPSVVPTLSPTHEPTVAPTGNPTAVPTVSPTMSPTVEPSCVPSGGPTYNPTVVPTLSPTHEPTVAPTGNPTMSPTMSPTAQPSCVPSGCPTYNPSVVPTLSPTHEPTVAPTGNPTMSPTLSPTVEPSCVPSGCPTYNPSVVPTLSPTHEPTVAPTGNPTAVPTVSPTMSPTVEPSCVPSGGPTYNPTVVPTLSPTHEPTVAPTGNPAMSPTMSPTAQPSCFPSGCPTYNPSVVPTLSPTHEPTVAPTGNPTMSPTLSPTVEPSCVPSGCPTYNPTVVPTLSPTHEPTVAPTGNPTAVPTVSPTMSPTAQPSCVPSGGPTYNPSVVPTLSPTHEPTVAPTGNPTMSPTLSPSVEPSCVPSGGPTYNPSVVPTLSPTHEPTVAPTGNPTAVPTVSPTVSPTAQPSCVPSGCPTYNPTVVPTLSPTHEPTVAPTGNPTMSPTMSPSVEPSCVPSGVPTCNPSVVPTLSPTHEPTVAPTVNPTAVPTVSPTMSPTVEPSCVPSGGPTYNPTVVPTLSPTHEPTVAPTGNPTMSPTMSPTVEPSCVPSGCPTYNPSVVPTLSPTHEPTVAPTVSPTVEPSCVPSGCPTYNPSVVPTLSPTYEPTVAPTGNPTAVPTVSPTMSPTGQPSYIPLGDPTCIPSVLPTLSPTHESTVVPTGNPTMSPTVSPTVEPSCVPSGDPTYNPSVVPTLSPTHEPTVVPTGNPTAVPTVSPTMSPTGQPSYIPLGDPTCIPSVLPTLSPTHEPTFDPTLAPTCSPTAAPTVSPTVSPSAEPTHDPTVVPTGNPTMSPTMSPTAQPSCVPSGGPTYNPTVLPTLSPTHEPTCDPTLAPTCSPTAAPTVSPTVSPSAEPTHDPTVVPTGNPSVSPSAFPTMSPTHVPTVVSTGNPTAVPTVSPTQSPSAEPSYIPSGCPTCNPSEPPTMGPSCEPIVSPTPNPTTSPTTSPTVDPYRNPSVVPSYNPSVVPTLSPTHEPTVAPTGNPTAVPTVSPTVSPTAQPSCVPSGGPTYNPTVVPTLSPTHEPTVAPTGNPTMSPTMSPTVEPSCVPSGGPTYNPSVVPTLSPTHEPTVAPTVSPTVEPSCVPSGGPTYNPSVVPTLIPTCGPTMAPTGNPTAVPNESPTVKPSFILSVAPTCNPSVSLTFPPSSTPTRLPTSAPALNPTTRPTEFPSVVPTCSPNAKPTKSPTCNPTIHPTCTPTKRPTFKPTSAPTVKPTASPTYKPTRSPTSIPTRCPTFKPTSAPTYHPTASPTVSPTQSPYNLYDAEVHSTWSDFELTDRTFTGYVNTAADLSFLHSSWEAFVEQYLVSPFALNFYRIDILIRGIEANQQEEFFVFQNCSNETASNAIFDGIIGSSTLGIDVMCDETAVNVFSNSLCWKCTENSLRCNDPSSGKIALPGSHLCSYTDITKFTVAILFYQYERVLESVPFINEFSLAASRRQIAVTAHVTPTPIGGTIYCRAYQTDVHEESTVSRSHIKSGGVSATIPKSTAQFLSVSLSIAGLIASRNYTIYCHVEDALGNGGSLSDAINSKQTVVTDCCREVAFTFAPISVRVSAVSTTAFKFAIPASPGSGRPLLTVKPQFYREGVMTTDITSSPPSFVFSFDNRGMGLSRSFVLELQTDIREDASYTVELVVSGNSAYSSLASRNFVLVSDTDALPAQNLSTAQFSSSGGYVTLCFEGPTDYAVNVLGSQAFAPWPCFLVFSFVGDEYTSCTWTSASCVLMTFCGDQLCDHILDRTTLSLLSSGESIVLRPNSVKSKCSSSDPVNCNINLFAPSQSVTAVAPTNPLTPEVYITASDGGGACSAPVVIDASASAGSGGRAWKNIMWIVESHDSSSTESVAAFLNNHTDISSPIIIPLDYLSTTKYTISLQLVNYLSGSSFASVDIKVENVGVGAVPFLSFAGGSFRTVNAYDDFTATVSATIPDCVTSQLLKYEWRVYKGTTLTTIQSHSTDVRRMYLPAYSLIGGETYFFYVTATLNDGSLGSALLEVAVTKGSVYVSIAGGDNLLLPYGAPFSIDASGSVNEDLDPTVEHDVSLTWSCVVTSVERNDINVTHGGTCDSVIDLEFLDGVSSTVPVNIIVSKLEVGVEYTFIATALSNGEDNADSASVSVRVALPDTETLPIVQMVSSFHKFVTSKILRLTGTVDGALESTNATWSLFDESNNELPLASLITTPISRRINSSSITTFALSMKPNSLTPSSFYTFRLSAVPTSSSDTLATFAELTLNANGPPSSGYLMVSPSIGYSLETLFVFNALHWTDDESDYPISYSFRYSLRPVRNFSSTAYLSLGLRSQRTFIRSSLPSGLESYNKSIYCSLIVSDFYGASTEDSLNITVLNSSVTASPSSINMSLSAAIESDNADSVVQTVNVASASYSVIDCTSSPNCTGLNREPCYSTAHTCSSCFQGYTGVAGDSNTECYAESTITSLVVGDSCSADVDCNPHVCVDGTCLTRNKTCPTTVSGIDCSGFGECSFYDVSTLLSVNECAVDNPYCIAKCICNAHWYGPACSLNQEMYDARTEARMHLCDGLVYLAENQDYSEELISLLASSLDEAFDPNDVSIAGLQSCLTVVKYLINISDGGYLLNDALLASDGTVSYQQSIVDVISSFLDFLSSLLTNSDSASQELLVYADDVVFQLTELLESLVTSISSELAGGESPIEIVSKGLRMLVSYGELTALDNAELTPPTTVYDESLGASVATIVLPESGLRACGLGSDYVRLSVMEWGTNPYLSALHLSADDSIPSRIIRFSSQGSDRVVSQSQLDSGKATYLVKLHYTTPQNWTLTSPNCSSFSGGDMGTCPCSIQSFTSVEVVYECYNLLDLCPPTGGDRRRAFSIDAQIDIEHPHYFHRKQRRRLDFDYNGEGSGDDDANTHSITEYGALVNSIKQEFGSTLNTPADFKIKQAIPILSGISLILFLFFLGVVFFSYWDELDYNYIRYVQNYSADKEVARRKYQKLKSYDLSKSFLANRRTYEMPDDIRTNREVQDDEVSCAESATTAGDLEDPVQLGVAVVDKRNTSVLDLTPSWLALGKVNSQHSANKLHASSKFSLFELKRATASDRLVLGNAVSNFFDKALPPSSLLDSKSGWTRFSQAVLRFHDWIRCVTYPSLREPRLIRYLNVCTEVMILMFVDSVFFGVLFTDDGKCEAESGANGGTEESCLSIQSKLQSSASRCVWHDENQFCELRPPPSTIIFYMVVSILITAFSILPIVFFSYLFTEVCSLRPRWTEDDEDAILTNAPVITRRSELGALLGDDTYISPQRVKQLEQYAYMEHITVEEETNILLASAEKAIQSAMQCNPLPWRVEYLSKPDLTAAQTAMDFIGVYPDGTPRPLTWLQWLAFRTPRKRIEGKLSNVRRRTRGILNDLSMFVEGEEECKDTVLVQYFILEQLSPFKRYALRREFFQVDNAVPGFVNGYLWLASWTLVVFLWMFIVYWLFNWAIDNSDVTVEAWAYQMLFVLIQEIFFNKMLQIFVVHVLVVEALRPQLKRIYSALNTVILSKMTNTSKTDKVQSKSSHVRVVQHLSAACRASRRPECADLPSAQMLMRVDDNDAMLCQHNRQLSLGWFTMILIAIPTALALSHETIQEGVMDVVFPTLWCCFLLANAYMFYISPWLLASPYVAIVLYICYRYMYLLPRRRRRTQQYSYEQRKYVNAPQDSEQMWLNMNRSLTLVKKRIHSSSGDAKYQNPIMRNLLVDGDSSSDDSSDARHTDHESSKSSSFRREIPDDIVTMAVHISKNRHFKYREKHHKKRASTFVNKYMWHADPAGGVDYDAKPVDVTGLTSDYLEENAPRIRNYVRRSSTIPTCKLNASRTHSRITASDLVSESAFSGVRGGHIKKSKSSVTDGVVTGKMHLGTSTASEAASKTAKFNGNTPLESSLSSVI